jgi:hypothetical protein
MDVGRPKCSFGQLSFSYRDVGSGGALRIHRYGVRPRHRRVNLITR